MPKLPDGEWALYVITCLTPRHLYVGITRNPYKRRRQHGGQWRGGAVFVKRHGVASMKVITVFASKKAALKAEIETVLQLVADNPGWIVAGAIWCGPDGYTKYKRRPDEKFAPGMEPWADMIARLEKANA